MAVRGRSSADRTTRWDVLISNLAPDVPQMPHLADDFNALVQMLPKARALETQQEDQRSQARVTSDQLRNMLREGDQIRSRLGATLKGKFGFTDATLTRYGFKPASGRRRKNTPQPPSTPPPSPEAAPKASPALKGTSPKAPTSGT
jgi:hypothetical protein